MLDGYNADGEVMGVGELELLRVLLPRTCEHCISGMMLPDSYDGDILTCAACGRSDYTPAPELLNEPPDAEDHSHYHRGLTARTGRRDRGVAQGATNGIVRRFA